MRRVEVKKIMKKNQVIITSLAILIAVAGYLNFADVDLDLRIRRRVQTAAVSWMTWIMTWPMKQPFWMRTGQMAQPSRR